MCLIYDYNLVLVLYVVPVNLHRVTVHRFDKYLKARAYEQHQ